LIFSTSRFPGQYQNHTNGQNKACFAQNQSAGYAGAVHCAQISALINLKMKISSASVMISTKKNSSLNNCLGSF